MQVMTESQRSRLKTVRCFRAGEPRSKIGSDVAAAEVASELAHQLNNPLQALTNAIYLARLRVTDSEIKGLLEDAESQLARMASAVRSIVTSRAFEPRLGHPPSTVKLEELSVGLHCEGKSPGEDST